MALLDKIGGLLGGGLGAKIAEIIGNRIADKAEAEKARVELETAIGERAHEIERMTLEAVAEAERQFNERTIAMEGTANDLKALPYVGAVVIFLRGAYRPLFAYFTAYLDWVYFISGMGWTERQESLLLAINLLVLIFFFGERAMKNVMPLIAEVFAKRA